MIPDRRLLVLCGALLLGGCQESEESRLTNSARSQLDDAVDDVKQKAGEASDDLKEASRDLRRDAARRADELDFGSERQPRDSSAER